MVKYMISLMIALILVTSTANAEELVIKGNAIYLNGAKGIITHKSSADLDRDGLIEQVFLGYLYNEMFSGIVVARKVHNRWNILAKQSTGTWRQNLSVTDKNGDKYPELIFRAMSFDGHPYCYIYKYSKKQIKEIAQFWDTKFKDLNRDGIPEVLSVEMMSFGFTGDHWLKIYKWNGIGYTDVSQRFPKEYYAVVRDLKEFIYKLRYTKATGHKHTIESDPDIFGDFYFYLGKAYEYARNPQKAKIQYAIAYRLEPDDEDVVKAFRMTWMKK